jgi:hypothetical protein
MRRIGGSGAVCWFGTREGAARPAGSGRARQGEEGILDFFTFFKNYFAKLYEYLKFLQIWQSTAVHHGV